MLNRTLAVLALTASAVFPLTTHAQGVPMDRTALITTRPFDVKIVANGFDVSAKSPVVSVKYNADGSGTRSLRDGGQIVGRWQFMNPEQTKIEVQGPEGTSRWIIVELNERIYRKVNLDTGVEFIHVPKAQ
jgi:hypothetical protein